MVVHWQVPAHHYCAHLNDDVHQCVIYDSDEPDARLIGVEYIISRRIFEQLPAEEKLYWHSHAHEIRSGTLIAPGLPRAVEMDLMNDYLDTYGKTIHLWQIDQGDQLPLGPPQLMMAATPDHEIDHELLLFRDRELNVNTNDEREWRQRQLLNVSVASDTDSWESSKAIQFVPQETIRIVRSG